MNANNIPLELLELRQWVAADENKRPYNPRTGALASVTDSSAWGTYDEASNAGFQHIGFVFTKDDPYVFIDLDNKEEDPRKTALHQQIIDDAGNTYTERSKSGKGSHIVVKADLLAGRRHSQNGIEIYPHDRFMLMTGNKIKGEAVSEGQELVDYLVGLWGDGCNQSAGIVERPAMTDEQVLEAVSASSRGKRFESLWSGDWESLHASQSEADLELCCYLAEYTSDDAQVHRLFLQSTLGQRDKAGRLSYLEKHTIPKARAIGDWERSAFEKGRKGALAILAKWEKEKKSRARSLLVPFNEFIKRQTPGLKLVKGILGQSSLSVLYGEPAAGKSFLALDICYSVATGQSWMGREVSQGAVIYACGEGVSGFTNRTKGLAMAKGDSQPPIHILPIALSTPDELDLFREMLKSVSPKILILDTMSRYFGESDDENSAKDMKRFVKAIGSLIEEFPGLHIMVVHHSGKDQSRGMRGSSALKAAADTVLFCSKNNDQRIALVEKQKDGQEGIALPFVLEPIDLGEDEDGEPESTCVVKPDMDGRIKPLSGHMATAVKILRKLREAEIERRAKEGAGNLSAVVTQIPLMAYRNQWYQARPDAKPNSVKKNADNQLNYLRGKSFIEWSPGEDINLLPAFHSLTIA